MKLTQEQVDKIKEKYKGYQVFNNKGIYEDKITVDENMPFVKVCEEWGYIELYDKEDRDIENFNEHFTWGVRII